MASFSRERLICGSWRAISSRFHAHGRYEIDYFTRIGFLDGQILINLAMQCANWSIIRQIQ
jgi:hypothetical protein